jgi:membrane protein YdbS with pleckstrin-like domain
MKPAQIPAGNANAKFNPLIQPYLVLRIGFTIAMTIIGIPLAVIWFLGVGQWWARHYFEKLECHLGEKALRYRKGILVQIEKTIPLENIQDVTFIEGPILRRFHLSTLKFETAGHSAGQANDMHLTGIIDAHEFRNRILEARDALKHQAQRQPGDASAAMPLFSDVIAKSQLATLQGIERRLEEIVELLKDRK